ncbi:MULTISPECIES: TSUP family transporter [unclassified Oceanispirochaeta]|uniref:TSUP family transporter n=1 Tax=unclassified Oceanispirochaeta TaxID=2635722 RepID=UPI000E08FC1E|nr:MULTISPECIES: TSUP family transporter [unclassified Oceanispirochaeta]MBF9017021.1 TSUP family transporter [Oceanispirochaeta sp. M2]NPD73470.1 TSUP family transporter [Oceanispirochaeta sp. M1]RDG30830.1 hypothetical protein DV872_15345 [Oceanispirochaeta sp. M1]
MTFEPTALKLTILFLTALTAGFVDSIAGGGGLITVPVLLAVGIPPHLALGTNKVQSTFGSSTAAIRYAGSGLIIKDQILTGVVFTLIGAILGTLLIQIIPADFLGKIIPFILLAVFFYTLLSPNLGHKERDARVKKSVFYTVAGLTLGFYDGFFGPGTGSLWTIALISFLGYDLKGATATTKITNFTSNIVALTVFIIGGKILILPGLIMGAGQVCGAWVGSHLVINKGTRFIRIFFLTVVALTILRLFQQEYLAG